MSTAYLNNRLVPLDKAKISILDRGFLYGDGVFETMRSYKGVVFRIEKHIERLFKSLKTLRIRPEINKSRMQKIVYNLLERNGFSASGGKDAYIKIAVTRGKSVGLLIPSGKTRASLAIYALPYKPLPKNIYKKGIKVFLSGARSNERCPITGHKTLNYLSNVLCRYDARKKGFDDAVLINTKGFVSEASSSNIFLVKGKNISTPCLESGILPGITRAEVIRLARKFLKNKVSEMFIKANGLYGADEVFLTNSLAEIIPVVKVDNRIVGRGKPGPVTKKIMELFENEK